MAEVMSQVSASTVVRGTVATAVITLGTTYAISVVHHDAPLLPMISDTFVKAPESYVSRLGLVTVATLLQFTVWCLHSYLCAFAVDGRSPAMWRWFALMHSLTGAGGSFALGLVGAINDRENLRAHNSAATIFFVAKVAWQLGYTAQLSAHPNATSTTSLRLKYACAVATSTALTVFLTLGSIDLKAYYSQVAACEWIVLVGLLISTWSLSNEFNGGGSYMMTGDDNGGDNGARGLELGSLWRGPKPGTGRRINTGGMMGGMRRGGRSAVDHPAEGHGGKQEEEMLNVVLFTGTAELEELEDDGTDDGAGPYLYHP